MSYFKIVQRLLGISVLVCSAFLLSGCPNGPSAGSSSANTVTGQPAQPAYNVTVGDTVAVPVTFTTDTGTATNLSVTNLSSLPAGWSKQGGGTSFSCSSVTTGGTACTLNLNYQPDTATATSTLTLNYTYTNQAGSPANGMVNISYSAIVMGDVFVVSNAGNSIAQCIVGANGSFYNRSNTNAGNTLNSPNGIATVTINDNSYAYISNRGANTVTRCNIINDRLTGCTAVSSGIFNEPNALAVQSVNGSNYLYVVNNGSTSSISVCPLGSDGNLGICTQQLTSVFNAPTSIAFYQTVSSTIFAYITGAANNSVSICSIAPNGNLGGCSSAIPPTVTTPISIIQKTFNNIPYLYVTNVSGSIAQLTLNSISGGITGGTLVSNPTVNGFYVIGFQVVNGSTYGYITNASSNNIYQCNVNTTTGDLSGCTPVTASPSLNLNTPVGISFLNVSGS